MTVARTVCVALSCAVAIHGQTPPTAPPPLKVMLVERSGTATQIGIVAFLQTAAAGSTTSRRGQVPDAVSLVAQAPRNAPTESHFRSP